MGIRSVDFRQLLSKVGLIVFTLVFLFIGKVQLAEAAAFKDMEGHWAAQAVERLHEQGIIHGYAGGMFLPEKQVTRAELVSMLVKALNQEEERVGTLEVEGVGAVSIPRMGAVSQAAAEPFFRDVFSGKWYFPFIQAAAQRKLVKGDRNNKFNPEQPVSRQETAVILARALEPKLESFVNNPDRLYFKDRFSIADWAWRGVYLVNSKGIIKGDRQGQFNPEAVTTRAELATMLFNWLNSSRKVNIPILTYHHLAPEGTFEPNSPVVISPMAFSAQMQLLKDQGYHTITSQDLYDYLHKDLPLPEKPVLITFDDGYESNYTLAFPILKKLGMKAVINIVVGLTPGEEGASAPGGGSTAGAPFVRQNHLTWEQMREMVLSGLVEIQSHTYDSHKFVPAEDGKMRPALTTQKYLPSEDRKEIWEEYTQRVYNDLSKAKETIEQKLGTKVTVLAYPYGAYNEATERLAGETGYLMTLTTRKGFVRSGDSGYLLKRINIGSDDNLAAFQHKLLVEKAENRVTAAH